MSFPSDRLLDVDKIKELAALIIKCDIDGSRDLINPLFELVSDIRYLHLACLLYALIYTVGLASSQALDIIPVTMPLSQTADIN